MMCRAVALLSSIAILLASVSGAIAQQQAPVPPASKPSTQPGFKVPDEDKRLEVLRKGVEASIAAFDEDFAKGEKFEARQLTLYAHYVLALGMDPHKAEAALKRVFPLQDMKPNSPRFGEFAPVEGMQANPAAASEASGGGAATEYTVIPMVQIAMRYAEKLSPEMQTQLRESLGAALGPIRKHKISPDLTNVYLQQAVAQLLIGELLRDKQAIQEAQAKFTDFITIARSRGIEEYVAPNYTVIQLSALLIAQNYTLQPEARRILDPAVKFMWAQVAANVLPRRGTMGGPHSRDIDFIYGLGGIDAYTFLEGMRNIAPNLPPFSDGLRAYLNYAEGAWRPDDDVRSLAKGERVIKQRWGAGAGRDRYFYITDDFAMGCSSAPASSYDKKLTFEFATAKQLPTIWVVPDIFDSPYGRVKGRNGQPLHPSHLIEQIAAVQEKTCLLALMNLRLHLRGNSVPQVATNVLFPATAEEVVLDGKRVATDKPFEMKLNFGSTLFVRDATAVIAIHLFDVDGIAGQQPSLVLKFDGNPWNVARLVAYQFRMQGQTAPPPLPDAPMRAGVSYMAEHVRDSNEFAAFQHRAIDAFSKMQHSSDGKVWRAKLVDEKITLEVALDIQTGAIVTRQVNGTEFTPATFKVNDRDWAGELLGW